MDPGRVCIRGVNACPQIRIQNGENVSMKPNAAKPPHSSLAASVASGEGPEADSLPEGLAPEIDPARFARAGERLVGSTSVARMPRLLASGLLDENTLVRWQLQGESGRDELDRVRQFLVLSLQFAPDIVSRVWEEARSAGCGSYFPDAVGGMVTDDHVPVNQNGGIPTIDIIPYYPDCQQSSFGPTWHTVNDTMEHIDKNTLQAVGQTVIQVLYTK